MAAAVWKAVTPYLLPPVHVCLLGYSMGGFVVQCMYAQRPFLVCGIVFASTTAPDVLDLVMGMLAPNPNVEEAAAASAPLTAIRALGLSRRLTEEMTRAVDGSAVPEHVLMNQITAVVAYMVSSHGPVIAVNITCPVLIIYGNKDGIIPAHSLMKLNGMLRSSSAVTEAVLPGVSHYIMIGAHQAFGKALTDWMATLPVECVSKIRA